VSARTGAETCPHQAKLDVENSRAAVAALETDRQRLEKPREDERQRLEPVDRPLEIERRLEPLVRKRRHERPLILAARNRLPHERLRSEARGEIGRWERGELAEGFETPVSEYGQVGPTFFQLRGGACADVF